VNRIDPHFVHYHEDDDYYEDFLPQNFWSGVLQGLVLTLPYALLGAIGIGLAIWKYKHLVKP
jgi:hypothetical protein